MKKAIKTLANIRGGYYDHKNCHRVGSKLWLEEERAACAAFKSDVLTELGLIGHRKAESIYSYVWDNYGMRSREVMLVHLEQIAFFLAPPVPTQHSSVWNYNPDGQDRYLEELDQLKEDQRR